MGFNVDSPGCVSTFVLTFTGKVGFASLFCGGRKAGTDRVNEGIPEELPLHRAGIARSGGEEALGTTHTRLLLLRLQDLLPFLEDSIDCL